MLDCAEYVRHPLRIEIEKVYAIFPSETEGD